MFFIPSIWDLCADPLSSILLVILLGRYIILYFLVINGSFIIINFKKVFNEVSGITFALYSKVRILKPYILSKVKYYLLF